MTAQRAAGVVWPHWVKTVRSDRFSYIAVCIVFVVAALFKCQALIKGLLLYDDCYFGSADLAYVKDNHEG